MSVTVPLLDDTIPFGEEDELNPHQTQSKKLPHPYVVFFHLFFRGAAVVSYIFCNWFSDSYISSFVLIVLLLSADFWVVKNITGRILVGLRWWNLVDDDGNSQWIYESKSKEGQPRYGHSEEVKLFWLGLVVSPVVWGLMFLSAITFLQLKWLLIVLIALTLNGANLHGYVRCHFGAKTDLKSATQDFVKGQVIKNAMSSFFSAPPKTTNAGSSQNQTV